MLWLHRAEFHLIFLSSENLAVTMEMNNEAIRYIEALREQYARFSLPFHASSAPCHFLRSQFTPRCSGIVCLKVTAKALNLNCNKNLSLPQNGFENARKSTSFSWRPSKMNATRNWNP
jgi:hypothetical protein